MKRECINCRFSHTKEKGKLYCRYKPPVMIREIMCELAVFPVVLKNDWCGKYERFSKVESIPAPSHKLE